MAKKIIKILKLQIPGGQAVPGQQLGPVLGSAGIPIGEFVKRFNDETKDRKGETVPTVVQIFEDKSYKLTYKTEPASALILKALGKEKGSGVPNTTKIGTLSKTQLKEIAEKKMPDLNANDIEAASKIIAGTARSMGVDVR
ncbi:MAG: 50S ribosomal protein L11 [Candidatus Zambryskibacteria bacterium RIFCSPLOWO2_12_FULL_45_14]|uniref:Large ribosomal subunit protein uL11 n=2 Tax=Candidatus Zambryskiibacteriota TaxID=1817925 RepID=A0A1G2UML5_9BACT|nr:MAG: 50S ribosomal protein L11 [Candidatus Zambryskibacteria bacterium RIFCSPLOWO2_02_FULL_44_12b]OHB14194.1 MAG: 50S ribosomal protein L11 [Candidatus Zambryskibacteria bacterium RIFCSPLOWO2_12_FULL_45_14]